MNEYKRGELYFKVTLLGESSNILDVSSIIFIGKNLTEFKAVANKSQDYWIFQDANSYYNFGKYPEIESEETNIEVFIGNNVNCVYSRYDLSKMLIKENI